ncbi:N-acetyl-gamma-glutamyl-phosphate reductase [Fulvivirga sp. RKSG066]|uniref:N-acetyl-gamma-glutamyl-phosphate reductase n=1 Tax=Fulvivirga aurantia TaxID=2529383 RepID=UPI0012BBACA4|nr:N-acetyl-gamma-glutamyl-phosphate reductase [Fulvivirga aurantia]MTI22506.1 N-acetyl-gamma-glutamyl-phosphate reductase [Fulvivirga aurantia]
MIKVGIIGGSGYVAGELIRCLLHHPEAEIDFIYSHSKADLAIEEVHGDLFTIKKIAFSQSINYAVDVVFLCMGHGHSRSFLEENEFSSSTRIIDLSSDFRHNASRDLGNKQFYYGLLPLKKETIKNKKYIANPGCFATAIQLALLPAANAHLLPQEVHIHGITGSTGAGGSLSETGHFSWRNNNISIYKPFQHQHLQEISESLKSLQPEFEGSLNFIPHRGNFTRGILASVYFNSSIDEEDLVNLYSTYYESDPYTSVTTQQVHLKQVVNTNHCLLQVQKIDGKVLITSVIDNLLKGAAGQAIQNMNILFNLDETSGLQLKASYF